SRSNHHDQTANPAQPTHLAPLLHAGHSVTHSNPLSAHYSRLESLLDSALATLTLIRDRTQSPDLPALTGHMMEVLQALCRHTVSVHPGTITTPTMTPAPCSTPAPSPSPFPSTTRPATYAEVMTGTATDPATMPANTPDSARTPHLLSALIWLRVQTLFFVSTATPFNSPIPLARRPHPPCLFTEIVGKSIVGDLQLTSIRWTTKGNLAFTFLHDEHFASDDITKQSPELWKVIRCLLQLPKNHFCPRVDRGGSWHNIVIHRVPLMNVGDSLQKETISGVRDWLQSSGVDVEAISLMCSEPDLASRETAALRVSLSSKKHADFLVQNGVLTLGSQCRVSHYVPKSPR
ncbi:hypothetical protein B0H14DRAFT_3632501, partial [Mycena olivaceomarginata]